MPVGRHVSSVAKQLSRAFSAELAAAGGSEPVWLTLLTLKIQPWRTQQELATAVGIEGPTLTHHLDRMERDGLIVRSRDPHDRRAMRVEMTDAGEERFLALREAAVAFDRRLRTGLSEEELEEFARVLERLAGNVAPAPAE